MTRPLDQFDLLRAVLGDQLRAISEEQVPDRIVRLAAALNEALQEHAEQKARAEDRQQAAQADESRPSS